MLNLRTTRESIVTVLLAHMENATEKVAGITMLSCCTYVNFVVVAFWGRVGRKYFLVRGQQEVVIVLIALFKTWPLLEIY